MRIAVLSLLTISCLAVSCAAEAPAAAPAATASISGTTVDGDTGAPLPGVSVRAYRPDLAGRGANAFARSDENGHFVVNVPPGVIALSCSAQSPIYEERIEPSRFTVPETGLDNVVVKIPRRQVVIGEVRDSSRNMVAAARVTVGPPGWNMGAITDDKGRFVLVLPQRSRCDPG